jgi:glycosyltransferase involved in cell wall biosynthesis
MRRKILLLVVGLGVGGTEAHVLELASRLDSKKFDVVVCSLKALGVLGHELQARGIRVISLQGKGKFDFRVLARLRDVIAQEQPDLVQSFLFWANVAARVLGLAHRKMFVVSSYHDEVVQEGWWERLVDRLTMRWTRKIVCCSEAVRRSVESAIGGNPSQFAVIPFGVEASQYSGHALASREEIGLPGGRPLIGTVCRLVEPKKGLTVLLEAVAKIKQDGAAPDFQLVIVGEGPAEQDLRAQAVRLGIDAHIVFLGVRRDVHRVLPLLDVFVLPSLYEGFGIAILEAMAAARPVVATTVGGIPEFVRDGETGMLVKPGDAVSLAQALALLLSQPARACRMGLKGQQIVRESFGIADVVRQHEQVYEACFAGVA